MGLHKAADCFGAGAGILAQCPANRFAYEELRVDRVARIRQRVAQPETIRRHVDNLWGLGGRIIADRAPRGNVKHSPYQPGSVDDTRPVGNRRRVEYTLNLEALRVLSPLR